MRKRGKLIIKDLSVIQNVVLRDDLKKCLEENKGYFEKLAHVETMDILPADADKPENALTAVVTGMEIYLELKGLIDTAKEKERIEKSKASLEKEKSRPAQGRKKARH